MIALTQKQSYMSQVKWKKSEKGRGTGIEFAIAPRDAGVDRDGKIELGHTRETSHKI